jgi:5-methylcytosine-specific restriction enzyme A
VKSAKLKAPAPRLATMAPRLGYAKDDQQATDRHRRNNSPSKAWYKTAWWQKARQRILLRDCYTCQHPGCGRVVGGKGEAHIDHIEPHNDDKALFHCSDDGLQVLCAECHSGKKQAEERRGRA